MLARRVLRLAKADRNRHVAHPLVASFPLETRLRHLANDPANGSSVRELAKLALTGGDTGDATPMSLWMLHDALQEHENADGTTGHPALHWQNWMSAGDKVQLDQHTHRALTEAAEDTRRQQAGNPNYSQWGFSPEAHAIRAASAMTEPSGPDREAILARVRGRVAELSPGTPEKDVDESIRRHALRAQRVFSETHDLPTTAMTRRALLPHGATAELEGMSPEGKANDLAARYRRRQGLLRLRRDRVRRYALQSGLRGFHEAMHSEPENHTHRMVYADWLEDQGHGELARIVRGDDAPADNSFTTYQYGSAVGQIDPGHFYASVGAAGRRDGKIPVHVFQRSAADPDRVFQWSAFTDKGLARQLRAEVARANAPDRYRRVRRYARDLSLRPLNAAVRTLGLGLASALRQAEADPAGRSHIAARLTAGPGPYVADGPRVNHLPLHPSLPVAQLAPADAPRHAAEQYGGLVDRLHQAGHLPGSWHRRLSKMAAALGEIPVGVPSISEGVTSPPVARRPDPGREAKPFARAGARRYSAIRHPNHEGFLRKMAENPDETTTPLVYADFLEENGEGAVARVIREHVNAGRKPFDVHYVPPSMWHNTHAAAHGPGRFAVHLVRDTPMTASDKSMAVRVAHRVPGELNKYAEWTTDPMEYDEAHELAKSLHAAGHVGPLGPPVRNARRRYAAPRRDFLDALRRVRSTQTQALHKVATQVAARLGLQPTTTVPALHDGPGGSVSGIAQAVYGPAKPEAVHALASWIGLTGRLPGVSVFHVRPTGPDALWKFSATGSGHQLRDRLDRVGLTSRVLIPAKQGYDVLIPDQGRRQERAVRAFARQQGSPLEGSRGHLKTVGAADDADARARFRTTIEQSERSA